MPLATRVIPMLLHSHGWLVKGIKFQSWRTAGHALQAARIHQARGVDELLFLDVAATPERRGPDLQTMSRLTEKCFMPITGGGGVTTLADVQALLRHGADKVSIGAGIHTEQGLIRECSDAVGRQAIVAVIETDEGRVYVPNKDWHNLHPADWAIYLACEGAGEILLMSRDRDGTCEGYDLRTIEAVARAVDIPVVAAGGCGTYEHMREAVNAGASAVAAGSMLQWTDATPLGAAKHLAMAGIEARV